MRLRQPDAKLLVAIDMVRERDPATANLIERAFVLSAAMVLLQDEISFQSAWFGDARREFFDRALRPFCEIALGARSPETDDSVEDALFEVLTDVWGENQVERFADRLFGRK